MLFYYIIFAGLWSFVNGLLHDIFVLREGRPYDRDLIRLLIDGHILIFSGIIYFLCASAIGKGVPVAFWIAMFDSLFLLGYCALIFKILPSFGTIAVNGLAFGWLAFAIAATW